MSSKKPATRHVDAGPPPPSTPGESSQSWVGGDHSFTLQAVMEMQKTLGKIEHAVERLGADMDETKKKVGLMEKIIFTASVVLGIAIVVGGWMLNAAKDVAMETYKASLENMNRPPPPPPATVQGQKKP